MIPCDIVVVIRHGNTADECRKYIDFPEMPTVGVPVLIDRKTMLLSEIVSAYWIATGHPARAQIVLSDITLPSDVDASSVVGLFNRLCTIDDWDIQGVDLTKSEKPKEKTHDQV